MGKMTYLLLFACLLQDTLAVTVVPLLANSKIFQFNPTQTTIALEKPYCYRLTTETVYLFVVRNDATDLTLSTTSTYSTTKIGASKPYVAVVFNNTNCSNPPTSSQIYDLSQVQDTLNNYVVRVGNDTNCFNKDPCNGPLQSNTAYSFLYAYYIGTDQKNVTGWSPPITTKRGQDPGSIDLWPGGRSGGMIVITSILSVLLFFVLAGLVAAVITNLMTPATDSQPKQHETQTSHTVAHKAEGGVEYATALSASERYSTNPQV
ncbi:uroplakin-3a [Rana temporaria]|uniref:uroplakin-3a n=1 Tax=Rana temporaria TaxID=8407 RepID=UPI001AAD1EB9|nr:uroplakin-3a [Rana temporaria]